MANIPKDPFMLVSYVNTRMRDYDGDLEELCKALGLDREELCGRLSEAGFEYDEEKARFI
ncbi:MAG TPA: DUF4250 domain-containing protein [Candidatus Lachnoclostridium stercoravium]|uniref:DUF4250 domain-containing protein n=1 Tax=Candidatus Lachnoclostridium stercoravium TaxID=2838633 RepID=A0A9D2KMR7_9FIRM|nr:DUF4250 domain-containing protein [Candidatus Lachnoclostridium stercoravium]